MKKIFTLGLITVALVACSDAPTTERILRQHGYTNIKTTGYSWVSCGKDDSFATGFTANTQTGARVSGVVCSGWFKGATIRTF